MQLANILITDSGQLKIADFGLAAVLEGTDSERATICGTPNYLSPEIANAQSYTLATDLWSLGVALYAMLTGSPPFQDHKVLLALLSVNPSPIKSHLCITWPSTPVISKNILEIHTSNAVLICLFVEFTSSGVR